MSAVPAEPTEDPFAASRDGGGFDAHPHAHPHEHHLLPEPHSVHPPHDLTAVQRFDRKVDQAFDRLRGTEPADRIFYAATELGDFGLVWILAGGVRALLGEDEEKEWARLVAALATESIVVNGAIKQLFKRERPVVQEPRPYKMRIPLTTSFPSGHSSSAALAVMLITERSRFKAPWIALAALVATSRVYVRIHHASDVVGGVALGTVLGLAVRRAWPLPDKGQPGWRGRRNSRRR